MKPKYILSAAVLALGLASCSNEVEQANGGEKAPLQITANIESTRATGIEDTEFNVGETIGFFVGDMKEAWNVSALYDYKWYPDREVMLDGQERLVRAYYPYDEFGTMENFMGFRVYAGVNHLVSNSEYVWNSHSTAELKFRHLMVRVRFVVNNPEKLELSNITLSGKNIYSTGLYYFEKNYVEAWNNEPVVVENMNEDKTAETQIIDALLIPNESSSEATVTLNYEDGTIYTATVNLPELSVGKFYRLPVTIANAEDNPGGETDANGHDYVDLGLPSGLKWATCNVGANAPEEYGDYFAWGETSTKESYNWETYKWCNGSNTTLTKYNSDSYYGTVDNKTVLDPEDDTAHVNWGGTWRMPTPSEFEELKEHCTWTWDSMNGHNGYKVTGTNGNSIFLPAAGCRGGTYLLIDGSFGCYWSSTQYDQSYACILFFDSSYINPYDYTNRYYGQSVRPVTE